MVNLTNYQKKTLGVYHKDGAEKAWNYWSLRWAEQNELVERFGDNFTEVVECIKERGFVVTTYSDNQGRFVYIALPPDGE